MKKTVKILQPLFLQCVVPKSPYQPSNILSYKFFSWLGISTVARTRKAGWSSMNHFKAFSLFSIQEKQNEAKSLSVHFVPKISRLLFSFFPKKIKALFFLTLNPHYYEATDL